MSGLLGISRVIDLLNERIGKITAWAILVAVLVSAVNAIIRKVFGTSSNAWLELQWQLFGAVFMLCAAWTLQANEHIRIDIVSSRLPKRVRDWIDLLGHLFFLLPFVVADDLPVVAVLPALLSQSSEVSTNAGGLPHWPAKGLILLGFILLFLSGLSEIIKRIAVMRGEIATTTHAAGTTPPPRPRPSACSPSSPRRHSRGRDARRRHALAVAAPDRSESRPWRVDRPEHGADHVRGAGGLPAARLPGRLRARRQRPLFFVIGIELGPARPTDPLDWPLLQALPERVYGTMNNEMLLAIPFFTFMGLILERSGMAEDLLDTIGQLFGAVRGGLAYAVIFVGALLAATTGVVAASVISMGLISLPIMLRYGYDRRLASGVIAASGTLAQIIPPSLVLIVMADQLGRSVGDMYEGAFIPGLVLAGALCRLRLLVTIFFPNSAPGLPLEAIGYREPDGARGVWQLGVLVLFSGLVGYYVLTQTDDPRRRRFRHPDDLRRAPSWRSSARVMNRFFGAKRIVVSADRRRAVRRRPISALRRNGYATLGLFVRDGGGAARSTPSSSASSSASRACG